MAGEIELADVVAKLADALDKMNQKIDKIHEESFFIDEFKKSKRAKFKTFADLIKKEFKDYLSKLATGNTPSQTGGTPEGSSSELVESGAKKIGGPVSKVRIEEVNPIVFKALRDVLIGIMPKKEEAEKEKKKGPGFLTGLLALLTGVIVGLIEYVANWFNRIRRLIKSMKVFGWLVEAFRAVRSSIFKAASRLYKMLRESKLFKKLESIWEGLLASIRESSLFKKIKTFFSEESFLGRLFKRIGQFFKGEGTAGRALRTVGKIFSSLGGAIKKGLKPIQRIGKMLGNIGKTIFKAISKTPLFKIGKIIGKALGPVFLIVDMITNTIDSVKQQGLSFKSVLDGLLGGIVSFFTLGILNFENIKKLTDKITEAFSEGNIIEGVMRILLSVPDLIFQGIGKIATWIADKIFGEDIKKKVEEFFSGSFTDKIFGVINKLRDLLLLPVKMMLNFLKDHFNIDIVGWAKDMLDKAPEWVKKLINWAAGQGVKERAEKPAAIAPTQGTEGEKKGFLSKLFGDEDKVEDENEDTEAEKESEVPEIAYKQPDFNTEDSYNEDRELATPEGPDNAQLEIDNKRIIEILTKQLEIMSATKDYLEKMQTGNNVATNINNQSMVNMTGYSGVNSWRQSIVSK
jgi:hypothetical protein